MDERDDDPARRTRELKAKTPSHYKSVTTHDFKTHFSRYVREMGEGAYPGVKVTSYGRLVGIFVSAHPYWHPHTDAKIPD